MIACANYKTQSLELFTAVSLPYSLMARRALIKVLREQGRPEEAGAAAREGLNILATLGGAGWTEVPFRVDAAEALREHIKRRFVGPEYGWMWPFPKAIDRWFDEAMADLRAELA